MKMRDLGLFAIALIVLLADQASKAWVVENIPLNTTYDIFPPLGDIFVLTHITNSGAAFGLFPQLGLVFTFVALIVSMVIVAYYRSVPAQQWLVRVSLGLQLGGAMGNLIDRLRFGYVTDMLYVRYVPVFNIADASIVTGVGLLMLHMWLATPKPGTSEAIAVTPADSSERME
jgi:signal peptidase II